MSDEPRIPKVGWSPIEVGECFERVASLTGIPVDELCSWIVIAVRHVPTGTGHAPFMVPSSVDDIPYLADVAEEAARQLRAAVTIHIPDSPPMVE